MMDKTTPTLVDQIPDLIAMVSAGDTHSLFLTVTGDVYGSGNNANGRLCIGVAGGTRNKPSKSSISNVAIISAGHSHSVLLTNSGQVYSCGLGTSGQLGLGSFSNQISPTLVSTLSNIVDVSAGLDNTFFINSTGSVFATGSNVRQVFGTGNNAGSSSPILLNNPLLRNVTKVSSNFDHSLFLTSDGQVFASGQNGFGQLGLGDNFNRSLPTLIATGVSGIATSNQSSYISFGNNTLYSFGKNDVSQTSN